jgi:hypothetical protein
VTRRCKTRPLENGFTNSCGTGRIRGTREWMYPVEPYGCVRRAVLVEGQSERAYEVETKEEEWMWKNS